MDIINSIIGSITSMPDWIGTAVIVIITLLYIGGWITKLIAIAFDITPGTPDTELLSKASRFFKRAVKVMGKLSGDTAVNERAMDRLKQVDESVNSFSGKMKKAAKGEKRSKDKSDEDDDEDD